MGVIGRWVKAKIKINMPLFSTIPAIAFIRRDNVHIILYYTYV